MSNVVIILLDDILLIINNFVGINVKYYWGDEVNFIMGVFDRYFGIKSIIIMILLSGWILNLIKFDNKNGLLVIIGRVFMN